MNVDRVVIGEGEYEILKIAKEYEKNGLEGQRIIISDNKVNINMIPFPDFSDFNFKEYRQFSIQTSRGCVSKCAFCIEHMISNFKSRKAENTLEEIKDRVSIWNKNDSGTAPFNIIDSSINSNLLETIKLAKLLIENDIKIGWSGYMRVHPGMDYKVIKLLKDSGAIYLSYGVETGSQKVADDMHKRIDLKIAERNLKDGHEIGVQNNLNWMVGFPTEDAYDFLQSLIFLYNTHEYLFSVTPGFTCGVFEGVPLDLEREKYGIISADESIFDDWCTKEYKNTPLHRYIRWRILLIWLSMLKVKREFLEEDFLWSFNSVVEEYSRLEIPEDNFDTDVSFEKSIFYEYIGLLWLLSIRFKPPFKFNFTIDKEKTPQAIADRFKMNYLMDLKFSIDESGFYKFSLIHSLDDDKKFQNEIFLDGLIEDSSFKWFIKNIN